MRPPRIQLGFLPRLLAVVAIALMALGWTPVALADSAADTFRDAYEHRYTWDQDFPGYSAQVTVDYQGQVAQGIVQVYPDLSVEVTHIAAPEIKQFVTNQLRMEMIHRRRVPFNFVHGNNQFELTASNDAGKATIREVGGRSDSFYQVKDQVITQVNRTFEDVAVTVDTLATMDTPQGYLVSEFKTVFRDLEGDRIVEQEQVKDIHRLVKNYYVLTQRTVDPLPIGTESAPEKPLKLRFGRFQSLISADKPLLGV